jgi:hypothetical protein
MGTKAVYYWRFLSLIDVDSHLGYNRCTVMLNCLMQCPKILQSKIFGHYFKLIRAAEA